MVIPFKLLDTPHIDRLAQEGMLFRRCMVPNSICGPSRAAILTGKYAHVNGFCCNGDEFDGSQPTFSKMLQSAGYQTAMIGKWHLKSNPTGFDHWHILPGQGSYYNPKMIKNGESLQHEGYVTDIVSDLSIDWLKAVDRSKPFLLMSQHKAPHVNGPQPCGILAGMATVFFQNLKRCLMTIQVVDELSMNKI